MGDAAKFVLPAIAIAVGAPYLAGLGAEGAIGLTAAEELAGTAAAGWTAADAAAAAAGAAGTAGGALTAAEEAANFLPGGAPEAAGASLLSGAKTAATIISPIASLLQAASGISAAQQMGRTVAPTVPSALTMPTYGGPISSRTQQTSLTRQQQRPGRTATIFTEFGEKLGA